MQAQMIVSKVYTIWGVILECQFIIDISIDNNIHILIYQFTRHFIPIYIAHGNNTSYKKISSFCCKS